MPQSWLCLRMLEILAAPKEPSGFFSGTRVSSRAWSKGYNSMNIWCTPPAALRQILFNFYDTDLFFFFDMRRNDSAVRWQSSAFCSLRFKYFPVESAARSLGFVTWSSAWILMVTARGPQCAEEHLAVYLTFTVCEVFICTKITAYEGNLALSLKRHKRLRS